MLHWCSSGLHLDWGGAVLPSFFRSDGVLGCCWGVDGVRGGKGAFFGAFLRVIFGVVVILFWA